MALIYGLVNIVTGSVYVGCTKHDVGKRMREHRCLLKAGKHQELSLQADWSEFGPDAFEMRVLETLPPGSPLTVKREAELRWMDRYEGRLYNRHRVSFALLPEATAKGVLASHKERGLRWTPEANLKRSLAQKGKPKGHGAKISATKRARRSVAAV